MFCEVPALKPLTLPPPLANPDDERFMRLAIEEGDLAAAKGEVPVGAILVDSAGQVVCQAHNLRETTHDPTAHAEVLALREASRLLQRYRMNDLTMYVTLEPCTMCAGALVLARVGRVVYGCTDPKAGAVDTHFHIGQGPREGGGPKYNERHTGAGNEHHGQRDDTTPTLFRGCHHEHGIRAHDHTGIKHRLRMPGGNLQRQTTRTHCNPAPACFATQTFNGGQDPR